MRLSDVMRRQLKLLSAIGIGQLGGAMLGGVALWVSAPWWGSAKWLDIAWVRAAFLLTVAFGTLLGAEVGMRWSGYRTEASAARRLAFRALFVVGVVAWFVAGGLIGSRMGTWTFAVFMLGGVGACSVLLVIGRRLGLVTLLVDKSGASARRPAASN
jgi:hypothetical protein